MMRGTIQKWGNSHGIRLPIGAMQISHLRENDEVEILAQKEQIIIRKSKKYESLEALFAGYHGDYAPVELDDGGAVGREVPE